MYTIKASDMTWNDEELNENETSYCDPNIRLESAILNPLFIFDDIIGISFPVKELAYIDSLYELLFDLFDALFPPEKYGDDIHIILEDNDIDDEIDDSSVNSAQDFTTLYIDVMDTIKDDIKKFHTDICKVSIKENEKVIEIVKELGKILLDFSINEKNIHAELRLLDELEESTILEITELFMEMCSNILVSLAHSELLEMGGKKEDKKPMDMKTVVSDFSILDSIIDEEVPKTKEKKAKKQKQITDYVENELETSVNILDKEHGCKLKKPKEVVDSPQKFIDNIDDMRMEVSKMLLSLNGIKKRLYIIKDEIYGTHLKDIKINKRFKKKSRCFDGESYFPESSMFKNRFLTYLMNYVIDNLAEMTEVCFYMNDDSKFTEYESRKDYTNEIIAKLCDLIYKMLSGENYQDEMLFFIKIESYMNADIDTKKKYLNKIDKIERDTMELSVNPSIFGYFIQSDDMEDIMKMTYLVTTSNVRYKSKTKVDESFKFRNKSEAKKLIESLGKKILDSKKNLSKLFDFYLKSDPVILSKWNNINDNKKLLVGVTAISFYAFITSNKHIGKRVLRLLEN